MYRLTIVLLLLAFATITLAQAPTDQQINTWIKTLSIKKDPRAEKFEAVVREVVATDRSTWCQTIDQINTEAKDANVRCQIRAKLLLHLLYGNSMRCAENPQDIDILSEALQYAYEIEDEALQYEIHLRIGQIYNGLKQYGLAAMHYRMLFDILQRSNRADYYLSSSAFYDMSFSLYHTHDYDGCIESGLNGLYALPDAQVQPDDTLNPYQQMQAWNTIGLAYLKTKQHDAAFKAFAESEQIARDLNIQVWVGIIKGNRGDVFYDLGQYDSAYVLLQHDYDQSKGDHQYDNAANSLQWLARIDLKRGRTNAALEKLHVARNLLRQKPHPNYMANVSYAYSQVYTALGQADSVNSYLQQYLHLHDSLQTEITKSQTDILAMRMNNQDQIQTIKILNRQKKQIALTRNFTIAMVILLGLIAYLLLSRMWQKRQQAVLREKLIAEAEAQSAIGQLEIFREHLLEKNAQIEQWQTAIETKVTSEDQLRRLSELTHHLILKEEDWVRFKALFDSVYPGFFISLRNKVPDITQAEQRMAALSKLKLTAKEAANLLGVSPNTVYTTKRRLRQRLGLEQDSELDAYL